MKKIVKKVEAIEEKLSHSEAKSISPSKLLNRNVILRDYQLEGTRILSISLLITGLTWITQRYFQDVSVILGDGTQLCEILIETILCLTRHFLFVSAVTIPSLRRDA
jgi:hypothetical protein